MLESLNEKANNLPQLPGVYLMIDENGTVIYVGKAKKLKNRVTSYFRGDHLPKVAAMVEKVHDFNVIVASSEFEALILENSLIKKHMPHYNILLKDDKGYPFVRIDMKKPYPEMTVTSKMADDGAMYFGPYGGRAVTWDIITAIKKSMLLPQCSKVFPRDIGKTRPCLNHQMGICSGWCMTGSSQTDYRKYMEQVVLILQGKSKELIAELTEQMEQAAEELRFEKAASIRDRLRSVENLTNKQRVIAAVCADTDAVGFFRGAKTCFTVLHFVGGDLVSKDVEMMDEPLEEDAEAVSALVRQYYSRTREAWPKTILLPCELEDAELISEAFSEMAGRKVYVETPRRGDRLKLTETAVINAREEILRRTTQQQRKQKALELLQKMLEISEPLHRIEAFDISNLGDTGIVAAMTVHQDGKPLKRAYKKFRIKDLAKQDDYGSMHQAVYRRFKHYCDGDESFSPLPDLLLIDGGTEHVAIAQKAVTELGLSVNMFGMVKDDRHRTRALITPDGREISISNNQAVFALVGNIQEETHKTAIEYQRSLRNESYRSTMDAIPGIGPKRRDELLRQFKSVKAIRSASIDELSSVVPKNAAQAIFDYFHAKEQE